MRSMKKTHSRLLMVVVLAAVGMGAWIVAKPMLMAAPPPAFVSAVATKGNIEDAVLANGTLRALKQVSVGAQVSGRVKSMKVALGDEVKAGQLVAEIESLTQQNALKNAEAALANVQAQRRSAQATLVQNQLALKRQQETRRADASPQADLEAAEAAYNTSKANIDALDAQVAQARITVDTAKLNLGYTQITSPIDGQVVAIVTEEGTTVNANQATPTIIKVAQLDTMTVKAYISEADVTRVKVGQRVSFTTLGEPDKRYTGTLRTIEPATDSITASDTSTSSSSSSSSSSTTAIYYNGLFDVPNPDRQLRISMTATVNIVRAEASDAVLIPVGALGRRGRDGHTVRVIGADGTATPRRVKIGINNNVMVQVLEGLSEGERVVLGDAAGAASANGQPPGRGMPRGARMF
jgi:macrolide-specific efflux system membrane fusion protein